ncbi:ribosome assembly RNA-binding protein YhbY [Paraliomyxa miuraensis]|uniref:ribosome assembly RNA-binding protein YhbY n=1 Tax=Paraliomyxa miuraensis TaxID=376150 RepID=UPI00225B7D2D|nr:ribosome assembly RNA-binding protein YhbY [Paraliomyxa miuraensis]MCX4246155.1 ribosome assembly RNA-binding protein YhbY [Paraliomyxa miuraensis]
MSAPTISTRARAHLRSLAHGLRPVVQVGGDGITEGIVAATVEALAEHELIKVKLQQSFEGGRRDAARELAEAVQADLTQVIGRVIVLYRPRPKNDPRNKDKPPIALPA